MSEHDLKEPYPKVGEFYLHYKEGSKTYRVMGIAEHTATHERLVIYHAWEEPDLIWARPVGEWFEKVWRSLEGRGMISSARFIRVEPEKEWKHASKRAKEIMDCINNMRPGNISISPTNEQALIQEITEHIVHVERDALDKIMKDQP